MISKLDEIRNELISRKLAINSARWWTGDDWLCSVDMDKSISLINKIKPTVKIFALVTAYFIEDISIGHFLIIDDFRKLGTMLVQEDYVS